MLAGLLALLLALCGASLVVTTEYGPVRGALRNGAALAWLNVPFASAPRFLPPVPPAPWSEVRDATTFGVGCPQVCLLYRQTCPAKTAEDCLQLNVFAPAVVESVPLPVVLYIPGGDFVQGTAANEQFDASVWANASQVVIVTINYRIGALGFAQFVTQVAPNIGMQDQRFAMAWIGRNIAAFGGDPKRM
jgi:para-nitrobenzyl esterase